MVDWGWRCYLLVTRKKFVCLFVRFFRTISDAASGNIQPVGYVYCMYGEGPPRENSHGTSPRVRGSRYAYHVWVKHGSGSACTTHHAVSLSVNSKKFTHRVVPPTAPMYYSYCALAHAIETQPWIPTDTTQPPGRSHRGKEMALRYEIRSPTRASLRVTGMSVTTQCAVTVRQLECVSHADPARLNS